MSEENYSFVRLVLNELKNGLGPFVVQEFADHFGRENNVHLARLKSALSSEKFYRSMTFDSDQDAIDQVDPAGWLRVMRLRWDTIFMEKLGEEADSSDNNVLNARAYLRELIAGRNKWGHETERNTIRPHEALRIAENAKRLLMAIGAGDQAQTIENRLKQFGRKAYPEFKPNAINSASVDQTLSFIDSESAAAQGNFIELFDLGDVDLRTRDLVARDLSRHDLTDKNISNLDLRDANLTRASLVNSNLRNAKFQNADLRYAVLPYVDSKRTNFAGANLNGCIFIEADLQQACFHDSYLTGTDLRKANLIGADLSNANLIRADMRWVEAKHADLTRANLYLVNLDYADLSGANLSSAVVAFAILLEANLQFANLSRAILLGASLESADLANADLSNAQLLQANLSNADLSAAKLSGADLSSTSLEDVDLTDADLSNANLSNADLSGANLLGANLSGTNLTDADLSGAKLFEIRVYPGDPVVTDEAENDSARTFLVESIKVVTAYYDGSTVLPDGTYWNDDTDMTRFTGPLEDC